MLIARGTQQEPLQCTKTTVAGAICGRFFWLSGGSIRDKFGISGQDATVFLRPKVLKWFLIVLQWKQDG